MTHVSIFAKIACAAALAAIFYGMAKLVIGIGLPSSEMQELASSPIYQLILIGLAGLGAFIGWKCAELILQSAIYIWITEGLIALIYSIWT